MKKRAFIAKLAAAVVAFAYVGQLTVIPVFHLGHALAHARLAAPCAACAPDEGPELLADCSGACNDPLHHHHQHSGKAGGDNGICLVCASSAQPLLVASHQTPDADAGRVDAVVEASAAVRLPAAAICSGPRAPPALS